ncbi:MULTISPECIES: hypothetical protein [unclassified Mucilaginibacter]|uniref:hypothetical protein n=1 Tax=unclassified Mucilaginibacter TaxID=2617802 RepID=UPI002AC8C5C6|nr:MULTISPECIES: hypothetical protein [unclassified Mucilaginibacter]MEB0261311.1 hypothetical protein [Mucilaginibacter sp. 10I4]MEB0280426.1 hypothetical protein [Mucilaginibacter sp. 10B2]MEB0300464.1 hypothetical protein [Mucilaginibacter sp. 5C4]WPX23102.1 hypothetical protein RHM67_17620 [Mucilaginibacter sp. 5C4]
MSKFLRLSFTLILLIISINAIAQEKGDPPTVKEGMPVSRAHLIMRIKSSDSSMVFKQTADVNGTPHYIGIDNNGTSVEFFGEEDGLKKAVFTYKFTTNLDINSLQYTRMSYFAYLLAGKKGLTWLEDCLSEFVKDSRKPINKKEEFFLNLKGFCKYESSDKAIVVSFTD